MNVSYHIFRNYFTVIATAFPIFHFQALMGQASKEILSIGLPSSVSICRFNAHVLRLGLMHTVTQIDKK